MRAHDIDIEGACGGCLSCATCHVIIDADWFGRIPKAKEDELDMLDLAYNLTAHSRLGCQITVDDTMDGMRVTLGDEEE
jgi:2Fe-2S ferredoxin